MENPSEYPSKKTAILLCLFLGVFGIHRFYIKKGEGGDSFVWVSGFIQLVLTVVLFLLWLLFDDFNGFVNAVLYGGFTTYFYGFFYAYSLVDIFWMNTSLIEVRWRAEVEKEEKERRILEEKEEKEREEEEKERRILEEKEEKERRILEEKEEKEREEEAERIRRFNEMEENFYDDNDLEVLQNGNLRDSDYQEYELVEYRQDFIEYKPEGLKGKRAYIKFEWGEEDANYRNYLAWSGPITKGDKAKFLSGDLEKVKEESQPITEDSTVQEKVDENVKVKQGKESDSSDASLDISSRLNKLTKLYEEGELTEEEYKQKTNELIS